MNERFSSTKPPFAAIQSDRSESEWIEWRPNMPKPELVLCRGWRGVGAYAARTLDEWTARDPLAASRALMLVPTKAAGHLLRAQLEDAVLAGADTAFLPVIATPSTLFEHMASGTGGAVRIVDPLLREALLQHAFERVAETDDKPPFELRSGLARRVLQFYDTLLANGGELDVFVTRALEELDAPDDEGAEKLARQTRFLRSSLESYRYALGELGLVDPPEARAALREHVFPYARVLVIGSETVTPLDLAFLSSAERIASLTIAIAESTGNVPAPLASSVTEAHVDVVPQPEASQLLSPEPLVARDREEALVDAARIIKESALPLNRVAIVVPRPLPYLYLARRVLGEAGIAYQLHVRGRAVRRRGRCRARARRYRRPSKLRPSTLEKPVLRVRRCRRR
jgi:hypothetical protein